MINTPESIRDYALERFQILAKAKYDKGQSEHGGILTDRECLDELEAEIIDFWFYLQGAKMKLKQVVSKPIQRHDPPFIVTEAHVPDFGTGPVCNEVWQTSCRND